MMEYFLWALAVIFVGLILDVIRLNNLTADMKDMIEELHRDLSIAEDDIRHLKRSFGGVERERQIT